MRTLLSCICAVVMPAMVAANPYTAENFLKVWTLDATTFEVIEANGEGARGLWCAAASYAERQMRMDHRNPIYVLVPRGPSVSRPDRKSVIYTINPEALPAGTVIHQGAFATTRTAGAMFPSYLARTFCRDRFGEHDRWPRY